MWNPSLSIMEPSVFFWARCTRFIRWNQHHPESNNGRPLGTSACYICHSWGPWCDVCCWPPFKWSARHGNQHLPKLYWSALAHHYSVDLVTWTLLADMPHGPHHAYRCNEQYAAYWEHAPHQLSIHSNSCIVKTRKTASMKSIMMIRDADIVSP